MLRLVQATLSATLTLLIGLLFAFEFASIFMWITPTGTQPYLGEGFASGILFIPAALASLSFSAVSTRRQWNERPSQTERWGQIAALLICATLSILILWLDGYAQWRPSKVALWAAFTLAAGWPLLPRRPRMFGVY